MLRVAVLVSGGGTNLQALIGAKARGELPCGELALVVSSQAGAYALTRAAAAGIETAVMVPADFLSAACYARALGDFLEQKRIDLIVLAGFLVVLPSSFTDRFSGRIINVHPSLIPAFCGPGCYGLNVHKRALKRGVKLTGATVHFVDEVVDGGTIIAQKAVAVLPGDTPETLQRRVMEEAEWVLLPRAVAELCEERSRKGSL